MDNSVDCLTRKHRRPISGTDGAEVSVAGPASQGGAVARGVTPRAFNLVASVTQVFSCNLVAQIIMGVVGLLIIRFMSEREYAQFTFAFSLVNSVSMILSRAFNRVYVVGHKDLVLGDDVSEFLGLQLIILAGLVVLALPAIEWLGYLYPFAAAMLISRCLANYAQTIFQQEMRFIRYGLAMLGQSLTVLVVLIAVLAGGHGKLMAWEVLLIQAVSLMVVFLVNVAPRLSGKQVWNVRKAAKMALRLLWGKYTFLFAYLSTVAIFSQIDVWVLRATTDDKTVATYGTAIRYHALLVLSLSAVHTVLLPRIQQVRSRTELDGIYATHKKMLAAFVPVVLVGAWLSQWLIPWIDQGRYPEAVPVFRICAGLAIVSFALSPYVHVLLCAGEFRFLFATIAAMLPVYVVGCWWLTTTYGVCGTATASFLAFGVVNGLVFLRSKKVRPHWEVLGETASPAVI